MAVAVKIGPWGALGGQDRDINSQNEPQGLLSIKICSSEIAKGCIHGISFVYKDQNGKHVKRGPWGIIDEQYTITDIPMKPDERIVELSGTSDDSELTSLKLVTNRSVYMVGCTAATDSTFSVPLDARQDNGKVVAFFARSEDTVKALGIYVPVMQDSPVKVGPWGDSGDVSTPEIKALVVQLESGTVYSTDSTGGRIDALGFTYIDHNYSKTTVGPWGKKTTPNQPFSMDQDEYVNGFSGTAANGSGVTSLKFTTNQKTRGYGPYGCEWGTTTFSVPLPVGKHSGAVVGFFGRYGDHITAIGVYVGLAPEE